MARKLRGPFGFLFCLTVGIIFDEVALGIIAGLFLGGLLSLGKTTPKDGEREG